MVAGYQALLGLHTFICVIQLPQPQLLCRLCGHHLRQFVLDLRGSDSVPLVRVLLPSVVGSDHLGREVPVGWQVLRHGGLVRVVRLRPQVLCLLLVVELLQHLLCVGLLPQHRSKLLLVLDAHFLNLFDVMNNRGGFFIDSSLV